MKKKDLKVKKKRRNIYKWKRNVCKSLNATGVDHVSLRGKHVVPRVTGPDCKCVHKCFTKVLDSEKSKILNIFNKIGHKEQQDTFLGGLIKVNKIVRNRPKDSSKPKSCACVYKIKVDQDEKVVCKKAFCSLFGINKSRVERIIKSLQKNIPSPEDKRGKHTNRGNSKSEKTIFQLETHIRSFPAHEFHYSRNKNETVRYLSPNLNIYKMYELYMLKYENEN